MTPFDAVQDTSFNLQKVNSAPKARPWTHIQAINQRQPCGDKENAQNKKGTPRGI